MDLKIHQQHNIPQFSFEYASSISRSASESTGSVSSAAALKRSSSLSPSPLPTPNLITSSTENIVSVPVKHHLQDATVGYTEFNGGMNGVHLRQKRGRNSMALGHHYPALSCPSFSNISEQLVLQLESCANYVKEDRTLPALSYPYDMAEFMPSTLNSTRGKDHFLSEGMFRKRSNRVRLSSTSDPQLASAVFNEEDHDTLGLFTALQNRKNNSYRRHDPKHQIRLRWMKRFRNSKGLNHMSVQDLSDPHVGSEDICISQSLENIYSNRPISFPSAAFNNLYSEGNSSNSQLSVAVDINSVNRSLDDLFTIDSGCIQNEYIHNAKNSGDCSSTGDTWPCDICGIEHVAIIGGIDLSTFASERCVTSRQRGGAVICGGIDIDCGFGNEPATISSSPNRTSIAEDLKQKLQSLSSEDLLLRGKKSYTYPVDGDEDHNFHRNILECPNSLDAEETRTRIRSLRSSFYGEDCLTLPPIYENETESAAMIDMASPPKSVEYWSVETLDKVEDTSLERKRALLKRMNDTIESDDELDDTVIQELQPVSTSFGTLCTTSLTGTPLNTKEHHHLSTSNPNPDCKGLYLSGQDSIMSYYPLHSSTTNTHSSVTNTGCITTSALHDEVTAAVLLL